VKKDIERFLKYLVVEKGFSGNTVAAYRNDLYHDLAAFAEQAISKRTAMPAWVNFNRQDMLGYVLSLKERALASTTQARKVAAAKSLWLMRVG